MPTYVALLRGIGPGNPMMRNEKLRGVAEGLGHERVRSVISSGNLVFESDDTDISAMEARFEEAWPRELGFRSTTIIRSREQLAAVAAADPYQGMEHGEASYLLVTFFKRPPQIDLSFPHDVPDRAHRLVGYVDGALFSVTDMTDARPPDLMQWLERNFGKEISSRTRLTVQRILKRMDQPAGRAP